ncbi:helical bundle domain-containing protein [Legionella brunensis]|uniref:Uncharacterized protein n=1 Tax=Legionella brunensis TaxID=29422 RepID=A0A0W0S2Y9_9GAMM|nr:helical bundle domain-containing protein [Legionella brunensis]KTC77830.1 hypothetical protein Lbru_2723 [Legionella brunensis]
MPVTTKECLEALRKNDYLQALKWLEYIVAHYSVPEGDADTVLQLAIYELIHHGFIVDDFHYIEMLYTLLYEQLPPFVERVSYNATVLCNAAMQYMVFEEHDLLNFYKTDIYMDNAEVIKEWMQRTAPQLEQGRNSEELMKKYTALNKASVGLQKQARIIRDKINYVLDCQLLLQDYSCELAKLQNKDDFSAVRLGVINSLLSFLKEQTIATSEVMKTITVFIGTIQKMEPYKWEEDILTKLAAKSTKPFITWFFDKSAEQFQFFAVKVIGTLLPSVELKDSLPKGP